MMPMERCDDGTELAPGPTPIVRIGGESELEVEATPGPFSIGQLIAGTYLVTGVLGAGGMGVVYDAVDQALRRRVAIKAPRFAYHADALRAEAQALAALRSPSFVSVHAVGCHDGVTFVVMERLFGETLEARIADLKKRGEQFSIAEVVDLLVPLTDALSTAHVAGIAQRDLKPSNVILCGDRVVLVDLGIAVAEALVEPNAIVAGSLQYMAPEVFLGGVEKGFGPMVDLYSLGIVAFELLTNGTPFGSGSMHAAFLNHVSTPAPDVRQLRADVPDELAALVMDLMAKDPKDRPPSAEAVLWQLEELQCRGVRRSGRTLTVLAVDDDPDVGRALKRSLESAFPRVVVDTTTDPRRAMVDNGNLPDVVLVDLNMPGYNGVEVCMHLAALPHSRRPVVVAMSAEASERDISVLKSLGVREFVAKDDAFVSSMSSVIARFRTASAPSSHPSRSRF